MDKFCQQLDKRKYSSNCIFAYYKTLEEVEDQLQLLIFKFTKINKYINSGKRQLFPASQVKTGSDEEAAVHYSNTRKDTTSFKDISV